MSGAAMVKPRISLDSFFAQLFALLGLSLGAYGGALSLYIIKPFWVKGGHLMPTVIFFAGLVAFGIALIFISKRVAKVEGRVRSPWLHSEDNGLYELVRDGVQKPRRKIITRRKRKANEQPKS